MFVKKVLMIVLVSVIYLINLNIPVAAEENEQDIIFSPNWMLENGYKEEVEENQEILPFATRVNVNWKVGLKTEKKTKTFHKNAGSKITVEASVFPTKKIRIGHEPGHLIDNLLEGTALLTTTDVGHDAGC